MADPGPGHGHDRCSGLRGNVEGGVRPVEKVIRACLSVFSAKEGYPLNYKKPESLRNDEKKYWHLYSLQTLSSDKFVRIVNKILRKEYQLFK